MDFILLISCLLARYTWVKKTKTTTQNRSQTDCERFNKILARNKTVPEREMFREENHIPLQTWEASLLDCLCCQFCFPGRRIVIETSVKNPFLFSVSFYKNSPLFDSISDLSSLPAASLILYMPHFLVEHPG